jgi:hypothetical protein
MKSMRLLRENISLATETFRAAKTPQITTGAIFWCNWCSTSWCSLAGRPIFSSTFRSTIVAKCLHFGSYGPEERGVVEKFMSALSRVVANRGLFRDLQLDRLLMMMSSGCLCLYMQPLHQRPAERSQINQALAASRAGRSLGRLRLRMFVIPFLSRIWL